MSFNTLEINVLDWGKQRGIAGVQCKPMSQAIKTLEETHELLQAVNNDDIPEVIDAIGDIIVTLIILSSHYELSVLDCLDAAYGQIKDRKGKTVNGTFIKE